MKRFFDPSTVTLSLALYKVAVNEFAATLQRQLESRRSGQVSFEWADCVRFSGRIVRSSHYYDGLQVMFNYLSVCDSMPKGAGLFTLFLKQVERAASAASAAVVFYEIENVRLAGSFLRRGYTFVSSSTGAAVGGARIKNMATRFQSMWNAGASRPWRNLGVPAAVLRPRPKGLGFGGRI